MALKIKTREEAIAVLRDMVKRKKEMEAKEINKYIDNDSTALCPYCEIDSIIPDSIDENIDSSIINEMNKYWF